MLIAVLSSLSLERVGGVGRETGGGRSFREWASSCGVENFLASVLLLVNALLEMGKIAVSQNHVIHPIMRITIFVIANHHRGLLDEFLPPWTRGGVRLGCLSTACSRVCCGT